MNRFARMPAAWRWSIASVYAAAVGVPLAILGLTGWLNYHQIEGEAYKRISRQSHALSEHAQRTFRAHELVIAAVQRQIGGWSWERILGSEDLHRLLMELTRSAPDIASVFVMHPDGRRFNSSRRFPMPEIDSTDRDYYRALRDRDHLHVSAPALSRLSDDSFFSVARRRTSADKGFDGLIAVSVNPRYFESFYATLVESKGDSVALVRSDGVLLARYPAAPLGARAGTERFAQQPAGGTGRVRSTVDGAERLIAFAPVGDYGVYATFNLSARAVWAAWRQAMLPYLAATLLATFALVLAVRRRDRAQATLARLDEEDRLQRWTDAVPVLVSYIDRDLRYRFNNKAYEDWFGKSREEMRGRHVAEVLGEAAYEKLRVHFEAALAGRSVTYETLAPYRDGGARHIHASYIPDVGAGGVRGMFVLVLDITARKKAELALAESDRAKEEFLATLAHELRNPLAPIASALEMLRRAPPGGAQAFQAQAIIERQSAHLTRLVDDLLDLNRINHGQLELRKQPVAVSALVRQALETVRPQAAAAGHRLEVSLPASEIYVDADAVRVVQALSNLLSNAVKYTEPGGRIDVSAALRAEAVDIQVRDTGVGIEPDMQARLFQMFARADSKLARVQGGLGIGLTLARRIAELHGGTLTAHSEGRGKGSEFTLKLPVVSAPAGLREARPEAQPVSGLRILVVDDNRDGAESLANLLRLTGNETLIANDGEQAVKTASSWHPDVILLDIGLPRLNGYDACRAIRAQANGRRVRIVALTGWGNEEDRRKSEAAGFDAHLVKPVDLARLSAVVQDAAAGPVSPDMKQNRS